MNQKTKGILLMMLSALAFSSMQIIIATTADTIPLFEQLFFRNLVATIVTYFSIKKLKLNILGEKKNRKVLVARSIFGYLGMITVFYSTANAAQGDVAIINKMSPFIVTILAFLFLKENITKYQIIGLLVAFTGAFFVSNPSFNSDVFPLFIAFLSAVFSGIAYTLVGSLKGKEHPSIIIFFFSFFSTMVTIPLMISEFIVPSLKDFILLICIGLFAFMGQHCLTFAYSYAKASEVSIYNYSGIIFSMILGFIFLNQPIKITAVIGGILVIIAGLIVFLGNKRKEQTND